MTDFYQVLARKWRPRQFADVVAQSHVVRTLTNALTQSHLHHAYLFSGTRGVGKTTLARLLAKCLNCEKGVTATPCDQCSHCQETDLGRFVDLIEVDAASRTKVEDTRELLDNVPYAPNKGRFKIYLIDEVHMLSGHSFNALLKTLEEPPAHIKFLLATTDPQRLPPTILSRCLQFHLLAMPVEQINQHLQTILAKENIVAEQEATILLAQAAQGSMRDALSLLDQSIAYGNGKITTIDVKTMLGTIDSEILYQLLQAVAAQNAKTLLACITQLYEQGVDFKRALTDLLALLHQIALAQAVPNDATVNPKIQDLAQQMSREDIQLYYQIGLLGQRDLAWAPTPRSGFEMTLLRILAFAPQSVAPQSTTTQSTTPLSWHTLLKKLPLEGATKILAEHCELKKLTDEQLILGLHPKHKPLMNQKHLDRIREAFNQQFNKTVHITVTIDPQTQETPASFNRREQEIQQQTAEQTIFSDPIVQQMIQTFDATVIKTSVSAQGSH